MKKYFNIIIIATVFVALIFTTSCDNGLDGTGFQDNPNDTNTAPTPNVLGLSELAAMFVSESDNSRYAGISSNYISGIQNQWVGINNYSFSPEIFTGVWQLIYQDAIKPAKLAQTQGDAENDAEMVATGQLLEAFFLIELASSWGDVPNQEAVVAGIIHPQYDSQSSVLQAAIDLLNTASANAGSSVKYFNDGIGGTTTTSTISQLANSIKARAYLLLRDYANASTSAQNGVQSNGAGLIGNHQEDVAAANNAYYQFLVVARPQNIAPTGTYLEAMLDAGNTTVSRSLDTPGDADRYNFYYNSNTEFNTTDGIFAAGASMPVISYYETKLIQAEALFRNSQESAARTALNEVRDALAAQFGGSFPHSTASGSALLTHILEEKYISIFPSAHTFHDLARTDNALGVTPKTGANLPERFLYTQGEIDANDNTPSPIPDIFVPTPVNN